MNFEVFSKAVAVQYNKIAQGELYYVEVDRDELYTLYLASFPEGSNPIYKTRTEHDCSCCKQFIRNTGHVVGFVDGKMQSIWDVEVDHLEPNFQVVADALAAHVKSKPIAGVFRSEVKRIGTPVSHQQTEDGVKKWNHFSYDLPSEFVLKNESVAEFNGKVTTTKEVFERGLKEISLDSCETVLDLIAQNSLYRGQEHSATVRLARDSLKELSKIPAEGVTNWLWLKSTKLGMASRFKNSVIGTLLVDITSGVDLEDAVKMFESKVAPQNYKRTTALITQGMIDKAKQTIEKLGLEESLARRYAVKEDLTINNVLFADRSAKKAMGVLDVLTPTATKKSKSLDKVQEVGIEDFITNILPTAETLELMLDNKHTANLVSLISPVNKEAPCMFKWGNNFSWSYNGEVADSMRERVKAAGGRVDGVLRFSIQWNEDGDNRNDFDAHAREPNGNLIYFGNKGRVHPSSGMLDVDIISPGKDVAVENIIYTDINRMPEGDYEFKVNLYSYRGGVGFSAEIEFDGIIFPVTCTTPMRDGQTAIVAKVNYTRKGGFKMLTDLSGNTQSKDVWGIKTNNWTKVDMVLNSPNHWDGNNTGNKHYFFMLEGCKNPDSARGFYNEFLKGDLEQHRKVFEVLASKMKVQPSENQLTGVGFSSTIPNSVLCRVGGTFNRTIKINF